MNLGLPEIILIVVIVLVLFGMAWVVNSKRSSKNRTSNTNTPAKDKKDEKTA